MLRFASSPTGDMSITSLRTALFNYAISQQRQEDLIVRIEDIDKEKIIEGKDKEILEILGLFGIDYTQVIYQSESVRFHTAMALQLIHEKKAFSCFCSDEWLEGKRKEAKRSKKPYLYDDACANLPAELVIDNLSPFTIRILKPIKEEIDSFIIMQQDKTPTYNFASAVDDMLNDISLVIHDASNISNTPKQEHIREALKYDKKIAYAYLPCITGDDVPSVQELLEEGFLPEAISNYLISIGNTTPKEIFTLSEAIEWLDVSNISPSSILFDIKKLRHINQQHLQNLDNKELSRYVGFADEEIGQLAKVYLKEVSTTKELKVKIAAIFSEKKIPQELQEPSDLIIRAMKTAPYFQSYEAFEKYLKKETSLEGEKFLQSLSYILTGTTTGSDIEEIYTYIKNYLGEIVK